MGPSRIIPLTPFPFLLAQYADFWQPVECPANHAGAPARLANRTAPSMSSTQSVKTSCAEPPCIDFPFTRPTLATAPEPLLLKTSTAVSLSARGSEMPSFPNIVLPSPRTHTTTP